MTGQDAAKRAEELNDWLIDNACVSPETRLDHMARFLDAAVAEAVRDTISLDAHENRVDAAVAAAVKERDVRLADMQGQIFAQAEAIQTFIDRESMLTDAINEARREERERCARIAATICQHKPGKCSFGRAPQLIAAEIRRPPASAPEGTGKEK